MVTHFFPNFLRDNDEYTASERHWRTVWDEIDADERWNFGWVHPWFQPLPPSLSEGNPIFSAVSPTLRRGIRIIQDEPSGNDLEIVAYLDTFGGDINDPDSIHELVISCVLSDAASEIARLLMVDWVVGRAITFASTDSGLLLPSNADETRREVRTLGDAA